MHSTMLSSPLSSLCNSQRSPLPQRSCRTTACAHSFSVQSGTHGLRLSRTTSHDLGCFSQAVPGRSPLRSSRRVRGSTITAAQSVDIKDRAVAALPYLVPLFDGLRYGERGFSSSSHRYRMC